MPMPKLSKPSSPFILRALLVFFCTVLITGCDSSKKEQEPESADSAIGKLIIREPNDLKICKSNECVDGFRVLADIYGSSSASTLINHTSGVLAGRFIFSIQASLQFTQENTEYAVFLVQLNIAKDYQDCHACDMVLAAAVYQYQNDGWRLFAQSPAIAEVGSYGRAFVEPDKNIRISRQPDGQKEAFIIEIDHHSYGQGHSSSARQFIKVWRSNTDTLGQIENLGFIQTAASDCNTMTSTEPSWSSSTQWVKGDPGKFDVLLTKKFQKSCADESIASEKKVQFESVWDPKKKAYFFAPKNIL